MKNTENRLDEVVDHVRVKDDEDHCIYHDSIVVGSLDPVRDNAALILKDLALYFAGLLSAGDLAASVRIRCNHIERGR